MCLAQGHNAEKLVRLEPAAPLSRVKHSTTEQLRSRQPDLDPDCLALYLMVFLIFFILKKSADDKKVCKFQAGKD